MVSGIHPLGGLEHSPVDNCMGAEASYLGVWDTKAVQGQREEPRWRGHLNMALQVGTRLDWLSGDIIRRCDRELLGHYST